MIPYHTKICQGRNNATYWPGSGKSSLPCSDAGIKKMDHGSKGLANYAFTIYEYLWRPKMWSKNIILYTDYLTMEIKTLIDTSHHYCLFFDFKEERFRIISLFSVILIFNFPNTKRYSQREPTFRSPLWSGCKLPEVCIHVNRVTFTQSIVSVISEGKSWTRRSICEKWQLFPGILEVVILPKLKSGNHIAIIIDC